MAIETNRYRPVFRNPTTPAPANGTQVRREVQAQTQNRAQGEATIDLNRGVQGNRVTTSNQANPSTTTDIQKQLETSRFDQTVASGEWNKSWTAASGSHTSGDVNGNFHNTVEGQALTADVSAQGNVSIDPLHGKIGAEGSVDVKADLVRGSVEGHVDSAVGRTEWGAEGNVGAEATATGQVVLDPLHGQAAASVHGEAFAGARASAEVTQEIGPATVTAGAEAFAGIGVEFEANVGLKDGKLSANFDVGAALGIGASVEFGFSVDVGKVGDAAKAAVEGVGNAVQNVGEGIKNVGEGIKNVGEGIKDALSKW
ncbi:hypothetical protein [Corallococcus exiguus]|uniref:Uncharacterized protein n=1 Tax=Corallococcus exiguus TaxID=83462 RepID=A0A7X5BMW8_9BACT|nr:hypothetical protein [Corallococcus exiguus]NBC38416.1 hypothetical protein [Corallococcus exiguus]TNV53054.1 hypothetical protein FH620_36920 [Corallococcus exiguus]